MLQHTLSKLAQAQKSRLIYRDKVYMAQQLVSRTSTIISELKFSRRENDSVNEIQPIAMCLPNSPELLCWQLACFHLGITIVPIIYEQPASFIQQAIQLTKPHTLLVTTEKMQSLGNLNSSCAIKIVDETDELFSDVADKAATIAPCDVAGNNLAMIIFSSGTLGELKGIMHSYDTAYGFLLMLVDVLNVYQGLTYIVAQPMGHIGGIVTTLLGLLYEGTSVLLGTFNIDNYMSTINRYHPTHLNLHTPLFYQVINYPHIDKAAFKNVTTCFAGGDDMPNELPSLFKTVTGADMQAGYGMTETGIVMVNRDNEHHLGSIGKRISSAAIKLCDDQQQEIQRGQIGEIWTKSPAICLGYWQRPDLNKNCFNKGWFRTFDLAREDNENYYWYVGRASSVIHVGDHLVYPKMIEQLLFSFPNVAAVTVIGYPLKKNTQDKQNEVPYAFLELKKHDQVDQTDLIAKLKSHASQHLKPWEMPQAFFILDKLPLNLTGKIDREALRKTIEAHKT